jgi:hypothetical protein
MALVYKVLEQMKPSYLVSLLHLVKVLRRSIDAIHVIKSFRLASKQKSSYIKTQNSDALKFQASIQYLSIVQKDKLGKCLKTYKH